MLCCAGGRTHQVGTLKALLMSLPSVSSGLDRRTARRCAEGRTALGPSIGCGITAPRVWALTAPAAGGFQMTVRHTWAGCGLLG